MDKQKRVAVIAKEKNIRISLKNILEYEGFFVDAFENGIELLTNFYVNKYDIALIELKLSKTEELETLQQILKIDPNVYCIIISGCANIKNAIKAIKLGAYDFILKPIDLNKLFFTLQNVNVNAEKYITEFNISSDFIIAIHQYLIFFKRYVLKTKGEDIKFEVIETSSGLRIEITEKSKSLQNKIKLWLYEYISFIYKESDLPEVKYEITPTMIEVELFNKELQNQINFLESNLELFNSKQNMSKEETIFFHNLYYFFNK